jgi:hypothetical protein
MEKEKRLLEDRSGYLQAVQSVQTTILRYSQRLDGAV